MGLGSKGAVTLGFTLVLSGISAAAEPLPPLLANFPVTQDDTIKQAYVEHIRASFPRDIRTSTLTALLEMDGFTVFNTGVGHAALFVNADFPCITDYTMTWGETDRGYVTDIAVEMTHKCG